MSDNLISADKYLLPQWEKIPNGLDLESNTVDVWCVHLPIEVKFHEQFKSTLSADELEHAAKFRFEKDRNQFIASRGGLRNILSKYLNILPQNLMFSYTEYKKPFLADSGINFNVSHSGEYIIYAMTRGGAIGIDIEKINLDMDFISMAKIMFSENEYRDFLLLTQEEQPLAFYRLWTKKEAVLKAMGTGFYTMPNLLDIGFNLRSGSVLLKMGESEIETETEKNLWWLEEIAVSESYVAAMALQKPYQKIRFIHYS